MTRTYLKRRLTEMAPVSLRLFLLAGMVVLLVGGAPLAQTPEAAQDDFVTRTRARAEAGDVETQYNLGVMYDFGEGVPQDDVEAVAWYRQAAEEGHASAQYNLGVTYYKGEAVPQDDGEAYLWANIAATYADASERDHYAAFRDEAGERLTAEQRADAQRRAREFFEAHPPE